MAIQMRRGDYLNFDPQKMKPGELAVVQINDPEGDGTALYFCIQAGTVKRIASYEDVYTVIYNMADDFVTRAEAAAEQAEDIEEVIEDVAATIGLAIVEAYPRSGQTPLSSTWLATESSSGPVIEPDVRKIYSLMTATSTYPVGSQFKWGGTSYIKINDGGFVNVTGVKGDNESTYRQGDVNITKANIGLGNVENKSSSTIRGEITSSNVISALGYTPLQSSQIKQDGITGATLNRYATCSTSASTAAKTASVRNGTFALEIGARVTINFTYANTADSPTLNINSTGAKDIYLKGTRITTGSEKSLLSDVVDLVYNGISWDLIASASVIDDVTDEEIDEIITGVDPGETGYVTQAEIDEIVGNVGSVSLILLLNNVYPVGSYYETAESTFDPNNSFMGTWVLDDESSMAVDSSATTGTIDADLTTLITSWGIASDVTMTNALYRWHRTA